MAATLQVFLLLFFAAQFAPTFSQLYPPNYYRRSCPRFDSIMQETTTTKQISSPTTAAAALRLSFHDCFVGGCDASILVTSTPYNHAERDAEINLSLPGDGFDVVVRAKTALELACPGVVSCADILAVATRNLVVQTGGPYYTVKLGRKDAIVSNMNQVKGNLPRPSMPMDQIIQIFQSRNFSIQEMVALSGAHTIGFSHCKEFSSNIYTGSSRPDPSYNPQFAQQLRIACSNFTQNPTLSVANDVMTPGTFDNMYYQNLPKGLGLLSSDHKLHSDPRTRPFVELYARNQSAFFEAFGRAMEKLTVYAVKTGRNGEIRRRCDVFNH
ncbi:unnamed protein product [Cuscuta epithymum]|uniref:Peroxidase n=1 Tax=Cuscuta epithymum TaxID=186058 RepID=A0AAV0EH52_9ASTE|nr:unnamed protein product [Cuscuta epithymum]